MDSSRVLRAHEYLMETLSTPRGTWYHSHLDLSTFQPGSLGQTWDLGLRVFSSPQGSESLPHPVYTEGSGWHDPGKQDGQTPSKCWPSWLYQALPKPHTTCGGLTNDSV